MATSKTFSGRKSAVMIRAYKNVQEVSALPESPTVDTAIIANAEITGNITLQSGEYASYNGTDWVKLDKTIFRKSEYLEDGETKIALDLIIPSCNKFSLSNGTEVISWSSFGSVYKDKMPTILDWSGSFGAKVDFGDNDAQIRLYESLLYQRLVDVYFYLQIAINNENEIDETRSTVQYGQAYIKSFNIDADPENVADLSMDFEGSGSLSMITNGKKIETDFGRLLGD